MLIFRLRTQFTNIDFDEPIHVQQTPKDDSFFNQFRSISGYQVIHYLAQKMSQLTIEDRSKIEGGGDFLAI